MIRGLSNKGKKAELKQLLDDDMKYRHESNLPDSPFLDRVFYGGIFDSRTLSDSKRGMKSLKSCWKLMTLFLPLDL